jgi:hypothetical protein
MMQGHIDAVMSACLSAQLLRAYCLSPCAVLYREVAKRREGLDVVFEGACARVLGLHFEPRQERDHMRAFEDCIRCPTRCRIVAGRMDFLVRGRSVFL